MEQKYDPDTKYPREPRSHPLGGIHLTEGAIKVKEVGLSLLKSMGIKIKEGGVFDLLKISRPAIISNHLTFLQCVGKDYVNTDFLEKAAAAKTPIERMKWVVTFVVSGIFNNPGDLQNNGPLNPVLGETYIAEKKDGTTLYGEQISHHPPIMAYLVVGPKKSYRLYGTGQFDVKMNGFNNIIGKRIGKSTIEFPDGGKIVFTNPETRIDGLLVGDRRYNFIKTMVFLDKKNKLSAEVTFLFENSGTISRITSGIKSLFGSKEEKPPQDCIEVVFFNYDKGSTADAKKEIICEGSGSWVSHFQIDGKLMWRVDQYHPDPWIEDIHSKKRLPSDSAFREDSKYIKLKDFDPAQREKDNLENRQRNDAKLRKEYQEKHGKH